jgi:pyruvate ferredoxin oxidoreductase alpha subunit
MTERKTVSPEYMILEAPREKRFLIGNEALAAAVKRANVDVVVVYPITPQSEVSHLCGDLWAAGFIKEYYRGEDELHVMVSMMGAASAGVRTFTATSGPGTVRAMEPFTCWAGFRLPIVCGFMGRGLGTPANIQPDSIEIHYLLETGMIIFHVESPQDFFDMTLQAYAITEQPEVHLPVAVFSDGFFVTHSREVVEITPEDQCLYPYDSHFSPVPAMDMETVPIRMARDCLVIKSNFISYNANASWQQEVRAAQFRARKHIDRFMGGPIEVIHPDAEILIMASGSAAAQSRVAMEMARDAGLDVGMVKIKVIRPFPGLEIARLAEQAKLVIVPEFNYVGWLTREIKAVVNHNAKVYSGPKVFAGMTLPPEVIVAELRSLANQTGARR